MLTTLLYLINMDFFNTRRTVRKYTSKVVDDALLQEMLEAAAHAPNTGNMQLYSVVVTRSEEGKRALAPAHFNQPSVMGRSEERRVGKECRSGWWAGD